MALIALKNVSKLYGFGDAATIALDDINLTVNRGECIAVMGPSGCGKSTLLNTVGLLDKPTRGTYLFNNKPVARLTTNQAAKLRRDTMGFIFQSFNLVPKMSVLDNVALPLCYKNMTAVRRQNAASHMLERVGLQQREYFMPSQLSGGQAQCVAIARALVNNPKLIIADEPTGNLDSASSRLVMELLSEINKTGNTIIFVTHNPELTRFASRVVYMRDGAIVYDEQTKRGRVANRARRVMYTLPMTSEDDDLAGVSALMNALSGSPAEKTKPKQVKTKKISKGRFGRRAKEKTGSR